MQAAAQHLWNENIGHAFDVIAGAGMALHANAERPQLLNPSPHLLPRDADFLGNFRAADHDGGVFGEEREERVDAAVRGAREARYWFVAHVPE